MNLSPKIRNLLIVALGVDGASAIASWNGTVTWHVTIGVVISSAIAAVTGYLTPQGDWTPTPAPKPPT